MLIQNYLHFHLFIFVFFTLCPSVEQESVRSRVAMDFTGSTGRIVEDPKEARAIALAEGNTWKKKLRNISKCGVTQGIESGVHITQPWFHSGMTRDQATQLVNKHGTVDGSVNHTLE